MEQKKSKKKEIKVTHIMKDGTKRDSLEGVVLPKELVEKIHRYIR